MQVNGHGVRRATHQEAVKWLVSQQGDIELMVQHVPQPAGLQVSQPAAIISVVNFNYV